jgi:hypothetical protein
MAQGDVEDVDRVALEDLRHLGDELLEPIHRHEVLL